MDLQQRMRQLRRRMDRTRPLIKQYENGELRVLDDEQRRLVDMYPLWVEDLEIMKQGRLPPVRHHPSPSNAPQSTEKSVHAVDPMVTKKTVSTKKEDHASEERGKHEGKGEGVTRKAALNSAEDHDGDLDTHDKDPNPQKVGNKGKAKDEVRTEAEGREHMTNMLGDKKDKKRAANERGRGAAGKPSNKSTEFVGDTETEMDSVVQHVKSLSERAREDFIERYVMMAIETDELQEAKKQFEAANSIRQKILSGAVSRPSKVQLQKVGDLPELRRVLNALKQQQRKEERRIRRLFEEKLTEKEQVVQLVAEEEVLPVPVEEKKENLRETTLVTDTSLENNGTSSTHMKNTYIEENHIEESGTFVHNADSDKDESNINLMASTTTQVGENETLLDEHHNGDEMDNPVGFSLNVKGESEETAQASSVQSSLCDTTCVTAATGDSGSELGVVEKPATQRPAIDWSQLKYTKNSVRIDLKAFLSPTALQQQWGEMRGKVAGRHRTHAEASPSSSSVPPSPGGRQGEKKRSFTSRGATVVGSKVDERLEYVRLNIPSCCSCHSGNAERSIDSEDKSPEDVKRHSHSELDADKESDGRLWTVNQRLNKELRYVLSHPIPRVTVVGTSHSQRSSSPAQGGNKKRHGKGSTNSEHRSAVEWIIHVSPADGPLAGQILRLIMSFSANYPFSPPLVYSTVFLPLSTLMVSDSGQPNTLRLKWNSAATDESLPGDMWQPEYSAMMALMQLTTFFNADAFASSMQALGEELYNRSIKEARLACGRLAASFAAAGAGTSTTTATRVLDMVNGPFILYATEESALNAESDEQPEPQTEEEEEAAEAEAEAEDSEVKVNEATETEDETESKTDTKMASQDDVENIHDESDSAVKGHTDETKVSHDETGNKSLQSEANMAPASPKKKERGKREEEEETGRQRRRRQRRRTLSPPRPVKYYEDAMQSAIKGPFEGCWGHLLLPPEPSDDVAYSAPALCVHLAAMTNVALPELELVALPRPSVEHDTHVNGRHWTEQVLRTVTKGHKGRTAPHLLPRFPFHVLSSDTSEGASVLLCFSAPHTQEEEEEEEEKEKEEGTLRCVCEEATRGTTRVFLPSKPNGMTGPVAWALALRVETGASANILFSMRHERERGVTAATAAEATPQKATTNFTSLNWSAPDALARTVEAILTSDTTGPCNDEEDKEETEETTRAACPVVAPLFCVASLETERAECALGVLCELHYPPAASQSFVPTEVHVRLNMILDERAFEAHFTPAPKMKKFFLAYAPGGVCSLFLPLAKPNHPLPPHTCGRLAESVTQLHRNPSASTAYTPPFRPARAIRLFARVLQSMAAQRVPATRPKTKGGGKAHEAAGAGWRALYIRVLCTFAQLARGEASLVQLCQTIAARDAPWSADHPLQEGEEGIIRVLEWLLAVRGAEEAKADVRNLSSVKQECDTRVSAWAIRIAGEDGKALWSETKSHMDIMFSLL